MLRIIVVPDCALLNSRMIAQSRPVAWSWRRSADLPALHPVHFFPSFPFISAVWRQEQNYENFLQREGRKTATRSDFVFLGIDQSTLELPPLLPEELENNRALQLMTERPFPWSREVWAILLDRLFGPARGWSVPILSVTPE